MEGWLGFEWVGHPTAEGHMIEPAHIWQKEELWIVCSACRVVLVTRPLVRCGAPTKITGLPCRAPALTYRGLDRCRLHVEPGDMPEEAEPTPISDKKAKKDRKKAMSSSD